MSKHTAGQWDVIYKFGTAVGIRAGEIRQYVNGEAQDQIVMIVPCAEYNGGSEATEANAHLIAAAPELYKALNRFVPSNAFKEDGIWFKGSKDCDASQVEPIIAEALDALAKAKGEA